MKRAPTGSVGTLVLSVAIALGAAVEPRSAQEHSTKALGLAKAGDLNAAEGELREAVLLSPDSPVFLSDLASILRAEKKLDESARLYRRALAIDPSNTVIRRNLAWALMDSSQIESAIQELEQVVRRSPGDALAVSAIATAYYQQGDFVRARDAVGILLAMQSKAGRKVECARAALNAGDTDTAEHLLLAAIGDGGSKDAAYNLLGRVYWNKNQLGLAVEAYDNGIASGPSFEANYLDLVRVLSAYNQWRPALAVARKSVHAFPNSAILFEFKGLIETMLLLTRDAMDSCARAVELNPHSARANLGLAVAQRAAGMTQEAAATFERGVREFPGDALHRQEYGLMLLAAGRSGDAGALSRGVALLQQAVGIDPKLAEAQYQLGNVLLAAGDSRAALERLELASKLDPSGSKIRFALARAYRRTGRVEDAAAAFDNYECLKAVEEQSDPGFPVPRGRFK